MQPWDQNHADDTRTAEGTDRMAPMELRQAMFFSPYTTTIQICLCPWSSTYKEVLGERAESTVSLGMAVSVGEVELLMPGVYLHNLVQEHVY